MSMSVSGTCGRRSQHTDAAGDDALDWLSGFRVLRKGGVFDALFEVVRFGVLPFLAGIVS